jgi:sugar/nucleoside kinase (ribokinase family)
VNIILLSVYVVLGLIRRAGFAPRIYGILTVGEKPLGSAILRFWNESGVQISKAVTDSKGRYYALVPTGNYRMSVEVADAIGGMKPYVSGMPIEAKGGVINQEIELPEI